MTMRFLISGWYGFGNVGDEAILRSMILTLKQNWPDGIVGVLSFNPSHTKRLHRVPAFQQVPMSKRDWLRWLPNGTVLSTLKQIRECDVFIMGGGGFLSDWQSSVPWAWLKQMVIAKALRKKTMLYGIGAGPFFTPKGRWIVSQIINKFVDKVTVRDQASYRELLDAGVNANKLQLAGDPVVNDILWRSAKHHASRSSLESKRHKVGVILAPAFNDPKYWQESDKFEKLTNAYKDILNGVSKLGADVDLIPFQPERDEAYTRSLVNDLDIDATVTVLEDPEDVAIHLRTLDAIVSIRLHGCILAASVGVPFVGIVYHHKSAEFIKQAGLEAYQAEVGDGTNWRDVDLDPVTVVSNVEALLQNLDSFAGNLSQRVEEMRINELINVSTLKGIIKTDEE